MGSGGWNAPPNMVAELTPADIPFWARALWNILGVFDTRRSAILQQSSHRKRFHAHPAGECVSVCGCVSRVLAWEGC